MRTMLSTSLGALAALSIVSAAPARADAIYNAPAIVADGASGADVVGNIAQPVIAPFDQLNVAVSLTPIDWRQCGLGFGCRYYHDDVGSYGDDSASPYEGRDCHPGRVIVDGRWRRGMICD